jgi:serine/threonine protein kinase
VQRLTPLTLHPFIDTVVTVLQDKRELYLSINVGAQLGSYEITSLLGKGGMGEVYRARDTKLKREVAIKILPEEFSRDADRVSRFQREAEVLASLNHSNIATIYDVDEVDQTRFLVLELIEGETLAERLQRLPFQLKELWTLRSISAKRSKPRMREALFIAI